MDAVLREAWADALESGEYKQGRCRLRTDNDEYCCLGVFLDILDPSKWEYDHEKKRWNYLKYGSWIPDSIAEEYSITGTIKGCDVQGKLMGMNDEGSSFVEIAKWIRENL